MLGLSITNIIYVNNMHSLYNNETTINVRRRFENLFPDFYLKYNNINFDPAKILLKHMCGIHSQYA